MVIGPDHVSLKVHPLGEAFQASVFRSVQSALDSISAAMLPRVSAPLANIGADALDRIGAQFEHIGSSFNTDALDRIGAQFEHIGSKVAADFLRRIGTTPFENLGANTGADIMDGLRFPDVAPGDRLADVEDTSESAADWFRRAWQGMDPFERLALLAAVWIVGHVLASTVQAATDPATSFNPSAALAASARAIYDDIIAAMAIAIVLNRRN